MPRLTLLAVTASLAACAHHAGPTTPVEPTHSAAATEDATTAGGSTKGTTSSEPAAKRSDFPQPTLPKGLAIFHGTLIWSDVAGAIWTMPADGATPAKQLSNQHKEGFAIHPFVAGDRVFAKTKKDLLAISVPDGPVTRAGVRGLADLPEEAIGDAEAVYMTIFQHKEVLRVPAGGGAARHLTDSQRAVLALHGDTLYVASYVTGQLVALPTAGGAPRTIARGLAHPTALAADDHAIYVYTETDQAVSRIDLGTGASAQLASGLVNSDELVLAGDALYTVSWPNKLLQLPTVPGQPTSTLADDLDMPRSVVVDDHYIYVTSSSPLRIVRVPRK
jgi:hypothetical protein